MVQSKQKGGDNLKLYHFDRAGTLDVSKDIQLTPLAQCNPIIRDSDLAKLFPNGFSRQGLNYLDPKADIKRDIDQFGYISPVAAQKALEQSSNKMLELDYELIRRAVFPQCQSRYTALFAVNSPDDFSLWSELQKTSPDAKIVEITVQDDLPRYDSRQLRGGIGLYRYQDEGGPGFYVGYLPTGVYDQAVKYWSGTASDSPRWEYLVPLPIPAANLRVLKS